MSDATPYPVIAARRSRVDQAGNVYACGPGGVWVLSSDGERLGLLDLPEDPHNLAFGDEDSRTLYSLR